MILYVLLCVCVFVCVSFAHTASIESFIHFMIRCEFFELDVLFARCSVTLFSALSSSNCAVARHAPASPSPDERWEWRPSNRAQWKINQPMSMLIKTWHKAAKNSSKLSCNMLQGMWKRQRGLNSLLSLSLSFTLSFSLSFIRSLFGQSSAFIMHFSYDNFLPATLQVDHLKATV